MKVISTLSEEVQTPLVIVQLSVYAVPAAPVKAEVGLAGVVTVPPLPLKMLHKPVPTDGVFPERVVDVSPHMAIPVWSAPAAEAVGFILKVIFTSSNESAQGGFEIVQRRT